jgi:hypothetical protein
MKLVLVIALSALLLLGGRTTATAEHVDLELVLAVDVSASVDTYEARLQRQGYLRALVHPMVIRAIMSGEHQKIAVTYIEWAGSDKQHIVVGSTIIRDAASARAFAVRTARIAPASEWWTSISGLIDCGSPSGGLRPTATRVVAG